MKHDRVAASRPAHDSCDGNIPHRLQVLGYPKSWLQRPASQGLSLIHISVQGWFLCGGPGCTLSPLTYWKQHSQYFTGKNQLMYLNCGLEGEEAVYITSSDGFYKLRGYSVYYERNQMMQDYMILRKDVPRAEAEVDDKVIRDFKQRMDERKNEAGRHRSTVGVLSGICSVLAVTVLAGGVAMFNNYQKMHQMESVIASVLSLIHI